MTINSINLVNVALRLYEDSINNFIRFGGKIFWDFIKNEEKYARRWTYALLEGEEQEAAIQLFNELEMRASKLHFADVYVIRKGKRVTVYDQYGPILSMKRQSWTEQAVNAASEYGRRWREFI